ncbi:MAG TPA: hypothetical protein VEY08_04675, partial [Chloroflexia bacterium]|nr:hypothetical protein [Chloroflexia bacterium]
MDFKAHWAKTRTFGITAILAGALALTLAACGDGANTGGTGGTGTTPAATTAATETGGGPTPNTPG